MMVIENEFNIGQTVYLKTDTDQKPRLVLAISVRPDGLMYGLQQTSEYSFHYGFEVSVSKDVLAATNANATT